MSKQGKRKITLELSKSKDLSNRPSVFERLGTKKSGAKKTVEHCRQWAQNGTCVYGKSCKFASTHVLISPSKQRAANIKDNDKKIKEDTKSRLHSAVVVRSGRSPDGEIDNWDQNDLEYADTDVLEKRRLQLQRELELQLKMDTGKDSMRKDKKKPVSSSSSSRSSSSSSASSSSSDGSSSSSSSGRDVRRKGKKGKLKRNSSSSSDGGTPSKRKFVKSDPKKSDSKKTVQKKDDKVVKKTESKKKVLTKSTVGKKSLSPGKKSGGTPPITSKSFAKTNVKGKSPVRKERNKSTSPHSSRDRGGDKDRGRTKERDKDKEKERVKERDQRARSKSLKKPKSRSPRRHGSKDTRRKDSSERSRPISPKKQVRKDASPDRHRKGSASRDRARDKKDRSLERRKDNKHDDKDRKDRLDRGRDRNKDTKRDDGKRRGRGLGRGGSDKGLEKPNKPMERLLPRPEERLAALAAISNRPLDTDKATSSKDRQDTLSERGGRKQDRERDRPGKRLDSMDREQGDYEMDRPYDRGHSVERYERGDDRYDESQREGDRSPGYNQGRDRHYDPNYEMAGPPRAYPEDSERIYDREHPGYDERRLRDRSWEGRPGSIDRERGYAHPPKDWPGDDYRAGGDWGRDRHWPLHEPQMNEWGDKEQDVEGWHHRGPPGPHRGRMHEYGRGMRMDHRGDNKRRGGKPEAAKEAPAAAPDAARDTDEDNAIPDDLSEISDDPDDILNRDDMIEQNADDDSQTAHTADDSTPKPEGSENQSTQDTSGANEDKESQDKDDDEANLDFEEISDGELEEERTRAGLGDALGVDWASLVADVRRREQKQQPTGGARDRWRPERVLSRLGLSVQMAGETTVKTILDKNAQFTKEEKEARLKEEKAENGVEEVESPEMPTVEQLHPVAAIQVAMEKRKRQRAVLFGSGCEITRALSARRDLALRRHLCRLPASERGPHARSTPQPDLFHAARALLMQAPVTG